MLEAMTVSPFRGFLVFILKFAFCVPALFDFIVLDLVSSVLSQEIS